MGHVELHGALVMAGAVLFDALFGEVPNRVHPVVGMGLLARRVLALRPRGQKAELAFGLLLVLVVVGASGVAAWGIEWISRRVELRLYALLPERWAELSAAVAGAVEVVALSTLFAGKGLVEAGKRMREALALAGDGSLQDGRAALSHLCSRNPENLGSSELCGATVESLAENASDSFVAPLFWYAGATLLGGYGLVAAAAYRAANTLDAMVGYRGKYEYLGKCAARLDDVLNWVPARLTALTLLVASALCRLQVRQAWSVAWREHAATESPNAGWPMALAAGALGVELTKRDCYVLGKGLGLPDVTTIAACERLIRVGFGVFTVAAIAVVMGVGHV